jgi:hypothetical protein
VKLPEKWVRVTLLAFSPGYFPGLKLFRETIWTDEKPFGNFEVPVWNAFYVTGREESLRMTDGMKARFAQIATVMLDIVC